jgi:hypothetical protein
MNDALGDRRRWLRWVAWVLCVLPLAASADQPGNPGPSSAAAGDATSPNVDRDSDSGPDGGPHRGARRRPTDEEWSEASAFLDQYSPKRMALARQLPDGPLKQRLRTTMYARYQAIRRVQDLYPQIYQLELQRLTIEDNLFDIHRQFATATAVQQAELRSQLKPQVQALFDIVQQDRQERINRMKSLVAELQTQHDADARNRDALISQQVQDVIRYGPGSLIKENNGPRRGGGGPGAPNETSEPSFQPTTNPEP